MGQQGPGQVILGGKGGKHFPLVLVHRGGKQLRLPPRKVSVLHVQDGVTALGPFVDAPDIRVGAKARDDRLLFRQRADGVNPVPENGGPLETKGFRFCFHLLCHLPQKLFGLPLQQRRRLGHAALIILFRQTGTAPSVAPAHVIVQTRPPHADILRKFPAAGGQLQRGAYRVQRLTRLKSAPEGAEIPRRVGGYAVDHGKPGIRLLGQPHKGIALVVLQQNVVLRHVPLDEGVFQHQRFPLAGDKDRVKPVHLGDHFPGLHRVGRAVLKILADAVFQFFRLAHVNDLAGFVHHQIDAGLQGQIPGLFSQLVFCHELPPLISA
ncbi:hypothetical protein SDC9_75504 [bioreactor metagenome]|uniref:Uncharacterized protein n=1 Tax=bioreactor metagenome TaxID=1076179 RepID=A0A644YKE1_9ZZZZ